MKLTDKQWFEYQCILTTTYNECCKMLKNINIPIRAAMFATVNPRLTRTLGRCKRVDNNTFDIEISARLFESTNPDALKRTVMHELLHTCKGAFNHGETWKAYADRVNKQYGISISRTTTAEQAGIKPIERTPKYICRCTKCGMEIPYYRMCDVVRYPLLYNHKADGGFIERIK